MAHRIFEIEPGSISDQIGLMPGDELSAINGERIVDFVDYQALTYGEKLNITIVRGGEELEFSFEKDDYEPLGIGFESDMMGQIRNCANECIFCFVDQLPRNARPSMCVKDDDWRTSLMMGSYVTLTNVGERELERIIKRNATPLYISAHATDPELRRYLLGSDKGGLLMDQLQKLKDGGISFHLQCVLCPGINDGAQLERTIEELAALYPAAQSLALVPVGLTEHREGLVEIDAYDWYAANDVLDIAMKWRKRLLGELGTRFVFPSDEFYIAAGRQFPKDGEYEGYPQIDNGVGLCTLLETEFEDALLDLPELVVNKSRTLIACGVSVAPFMRKLLAEHPIPGVEVCVRALVNDHFGHSVTVSGLLTGADLAKQLRGACCDRVLITECMLRDGEDVFLDNMRLSELESILKVPVIPVGRTGEALLNALTGNY